MKHLFMKSSTSVKEFRGRRRSTIFIAQNRNIERTKKRFKEFDVKPVKFQLGLINLRVKVTNSNGWRRRVNIVVVAACPINTYMQ